jgi:hypothetical protein
MIGGPPIIFISDGTDITPRRAGENIDLGAGGLKDDTTSVVIPLSSAGDPALDTIKKTLTGAINENAALIAGLLGVGTLTSKTDPALDSISVSDVDDFIGCVITLTAAGNDQTLPSPTAANQWPFYTVINNDTSTHSIDIIGSSTQTLLPGETTNFAWDGSAWIAFSADSIIWIDDGTDIKALVSTRNIDLQNGLLKISGLETLNKNVLTLIETTTPTPVAGSGKLYTKSDNILYFQDGAGTETAVGFVVWGNTRSGTSGAGLTHTIGAGAASNAQSFLTTVNDTQSNLLIVNQINLGASALGHIGYYVVARGNSPTEQAFRADIERGIGFHVVDLEDSNNDGAGFLYQNGKVGLQAGVAFKALSVATRTFNARSTDINLTATADQAGRTIEANRFISSRLTAFNISDDYDAFSILKNVNKNGGGGTTFNSAGAALKVELAANLDFGVLNESSHVIEIVQDALSTGYPIDITQNAVVSTNFKKVINAAGVTQWISDGTTPAGNLSGTTGDVCYNGPSGESYRCTGTTNWLPQSEGASLAEMYFDNNAVATVMETANSPIGVLNYTAGTLRGWTFGAGSTNGITAYADYSGTVAGTVLVTSAGHGLSTGDFVVIRGTTNYNGVFQATVVDASNFYITVTWVADDGASDFDQPSYLEYTSGPSLNFQLSFGVSTTKGAGTPATVIWTWYVNTTAQDKSRIQRKIPATDVGAISGNCIITAQGGDRVFLTMTSDNTDNLTNSYGAVTLQHA